MEDAFLRFVESARQTLSECIREGAKEGDCEVAGWGWVCSRVLSCCQAYPSGVTDAIVLSDLYQAWMEKDRLHRRRMSKGRSDGDAGNFALEKRSKSQRPRLPKTTSIDYILEKKFISLDAVLEAVVLDVHLLPGTSSYMLRLGDFWSSSSIDLYLHRKFYDLISADSGILKAHREIRLTGCRLRFALDSATPQLLPTEYMTVLLFEEHDEDALLLGAQFCSDTFSCVSSDPAQWADFSFYARLEKIGEVEVETLRERKQVKLLLRDCNNDPMLLILWDEHIPLANLLSEGSMIAIERPSIEQVEDIALHGLCLKYGTCTHLYVVPYVPTKEQVSIRTNLSQEHLQNLPSDSQMLSVSQVTLPVDSQGAVDYTDYPFWLSIGNLRPKMSKVTLYGQVASIVSDGKSSATFFLHLMDRTGTTTIKLIFSQYWSGGDLRRGHLIFISGLVTVTSTAGGVDCTWSENDAGSQLVNVTLLPALLSSFCLHDLAPVSTIFVSKHMQISRIRIRKLQLSDLRIFPCHVRCGRPTKGNADAWNCGFCRRVCEAKDIANMFYATISFIDTSVLGVAGVRQAQCYGQAAAEILQTSPDDFCSWPLDEQEFFLCYVENKEYLVSLYIESEKDDSGTKQGPSLSIGRAFKV